MRKVILKKRHGYLHHLCLMLFFFLAVSCGVKPDKELTFAFMGDLHYSVQDSLKTDSLVQSVAKELNNLPVKPEFIIQTGDFFHGSNGGNIQNEAAMAFRHFARDIGMPFYISKGNHDSRTPYEKCALPIFSRELGFDVLKSYYSFDKANCHFIMLDCTEEDLPEMLLWLEKDLKTAKSSPKTEHIFAAGHFPLWIVARAGFTAPEYASRVASLLAKYKADAYFCGHTHNKTVTVRLIDNQPVTQIMDASVVEKGRLFMLAPFMYHVKTKPPDDTQPGILPLEEGHQIFIPGYQLKYYWGYQEGSSTSYYSFTVSGRSVKADWYVLDQGLVRSFKWDEPGKLTDLKSPAKTEKELLSDNDFKKISKAWFYAAPWIEKDSVSAPISINGIKAGTIKISGIKMAGSPFWNKIEVPLNEPAIDAIKINNEISITNPENAKFGLAHIFLLVQFKDGHFARSNIAPKVLTSFDPSGGEYYGFPARELIESVNTGDPLARVFSSFDRFY
jgi:hypothetical protein